MKTNDWRAAAERAEIYRAEADRVRAREPKAAADLDLSAAAHDSLAAQMRRDERADLAHIVAHGSPIGAGAEHVSGAAGEYLAFLRTGRDPQNASLSTTDANGGYLVPEPLHAELNEAARKVDPIAAHAHLFDLAGGNASMQLPYKATHGAVANATETGARSEQSAPTFEGPTLTTYDYYTDQRATQTELDSVSGLEGMILTWIYQDIWEQAGVSFAVGDGDTKASGLFAATDVYDVELSGAAGALAAGNFLTLVTKLKPQYQANAAFYMTSTTLATVSGMSHPAASGYVPLVDWASGEARILGRPVHIATSAPEIGAANYPVAFGDLGAGYAIGVHHAPSVLRDPFTATPKVRFYGLGRIGGRPWNPEAVILLKSNDS